MDYKMLTKILSIKDEVDMLYWLDVTDGLMFGYELYLINCDIAVPFTRMALALDELNSEIFFLWTDYLTKIKEQSLLNNLPNSEGRLAGFMPFLRVLMLSETQKASSRIWTRVIDSISNDDKRHFKSTYSGASSAYITSYNWIQTIDNR